MKTTAVFAEMIIVGFLGLLWMVILIAEHFGVSQAQIVTFLANYKDVLTPLSVLFFLVCYNVGWLINGVAYWLTGKIFVESYRDKLIEVAKIESSYHDIRVAVYQEASPQLLSELDTDRAVLRLSRTGLVNFPMLAVAVLLSTSVSNIFAIVALVFLLLSILQWYQRSKRFYRQIVNLYKRLDNKDKVL